MLRRIITDIASLFARLFYPRYLYWHVLAIALTLFLVETGADWKYFLLTRSLWHYGLFSAVVGFFVPAIIPALLLLWGSLRSSAVHIRAAYTVAIAEALGYLISIFYKCFSGRSAPDYFSYSPGHDISADFHFGILGNGVFWGWPSSHTAVAFAMAAALVVLFPRNRAIRIAAPLYALWIGIGVSMSIHWLSDFAAGAIFGSLAGYVAARALQRGLSSSR